MPPRAYMFTHRFPKLLAMTETELNAVAADVRTGENICDLTERFTSELRHPASHALMTILGQF